MIRTSLAVAAALLLTGCAPEDTSPRHLVQPGATSVPFSTNTPPAPAPRPDTYRVDRVVDGDTVRIIRNGKSVPLRLIGGDTPETVHPTRPVECYGPEASAEAKRLLTGKRVQVVYDPTQGRLDKYGRDLVYLHLPDGRDFMEHMIATGHAEEYRYRTDYQRMDDYRAAERHAQDTGAGMWSRCS